MAKTIAITAEVPSFGTLNARWQEFTALALFVSTYLALVIDAAIHRPFWFDELSTYYVSRTSWHQLYRAMLADGNPPLYFLLARLSLHLPISIELAMRLPAILAFLISALTIYIFVRQGAGWIFALLSLALYLGAPIRQYALEARAYSLLLAFTGLILCCWQLRCRGRTRFALIGISIGVSGAILSHQYGVIYAIFPLAVAELVRSVRIRKIDYQLLGAAANPLPILLLTYPPMLKEQQPLLWAIRNCPVFFAHPQLKDLRDYTAMLPPFIPPILAIAAVATLTWLALFGEPRSEQTPVYAEEFAIAIALSMFVPLMLLLTHFGSGFYQLRYGLGSAMGLAMLVGMSVAHVRWRHKPAVAVFGITYSTVLIVLGLWVASAPRETSSWRDPILSSAIDTEQPIVVASALEYSPMWWYATPPLRSRLHSLSDLEYARKRSDLVPEYSLYLERAFTPMQLDGYNSFLATHNNFYLYSSGEARLEWVRTRLEEEGWKLTLLRNQKQRLPDREGEIRIHSLYEVSRCQKRSED